MGGRGGGEEGGGDEGEDEGEFFSFFFFHASLARKLPRRSALLTLGQRCCPYAAAGVRLRPGPRGLVRLEAVCNSVLFSVSARAHTPTNTGRREKESLELDSGRRAVIIIQTA